MSFPEYLKGRISEDYKNLIIQKLQEIKEHTDQLKTAITPSAGKIQNNLRETVERELSRIAEMLEAETETLERQMHERISEALEQYTEKWYHSDITAYSQQLEVLLSDIVSNLPASSKTASHELQSVVQLMHEADRGNTQSEILNILLQHVAEWVDRAVLFVVKADQASGWAAVGLGSDWDSARVRSIRVDLKPSTLLREVVENAEASFGTGDQYPENTSIFNQLGDHKPQSALAFPVMVRGKIAGILYADLANENLEARPDLRNFLYLACRAAAYAIDLLPLKRKGAPVAEPKQKAENVAAPVPSVEPQIEEEEADEPARTVMMPAQQMPPPPLTQEEQKLHDDAKRFARLLVSEIKLYNEAQVAAGRENKDLYERLKDDIERSRKMYMDRVPIHVYSSTNYFYEELVRTLANGDPAVLGM